MRCSKLTIVVAVTMLGTLQPIASALAADASPPPTKAIPLKPVPPIPFFYINDNRLTIAYAPNGSTPNIPQRVQEEVLAYTHFDAWAYGTNFLNFVVTKNDKGAPSAPCSVPNQGCAGAIAPFATFRSTLGFNELSDSKAFSFGPLRDISFVAGADGGSRNTTSGLVFYGVTAGLQFAFDLPYKGYINIAPMIYKEWIYLGTTTPFGPFKPGIPDGISDLNPTWAVDANYYMDLGFLPETVPLAISGRMSIIGPGGFGYAAGQLPAAAFPKTVTQFYTEPFRLTLDASKMIWGKQYSHDLDVWVAYKYSQNILALDHNLAPVCKGGACTESTVYTGVTVKF